jgi:spore coat polysaccharide biosynthesis protein SpsF
MRTRTVAIVQARMGSIRFPGKMISQLGGITLIEWVLMRLSKTTTLDNIILATSLEKSNDILEGLAQKIGISSFRGSEEDVLSRFLGAAKASEAKNIVRVCADNPFIDPYEVDRLVDYFFNNQCDYVCNHRNYGENKYADGFGAEILTLSLLEQIESLSITSYHREHVTSFLFDHVSDYTIHAMIPPQDLAYPKLRFDVDRLEDLHKLQAMVNAGVNINSSASSIVKIALGID